MNRIFLALGFILLMFFASCASKPVIVEPILGKETVAYTAPVYNYYGNHLNREVEREGRMLYSLDSLLTLKKERLSIEERVDINNELGMNVLYLFKKLESDSLAQAPKLLKEMKIDTEAKYLMFFYYEMREAYISQINRYIWHPNKNVAIMDIATRDILFYKNLSDEDIYKGLDEKLLEALKTLK